MGQPTWRVIKTQLVPERPGCVWTPALDYLTPGRLYKIGVPELPKEPAEGDAGDETTVLQTWTPESVTEPCTADGTGAEITRKNGTVPLTDVRVGALIGRIGGSTADHVGQAEKMVLFAVGRYCVFQAPEAPKTGPLYLGVNDTSGSACHLKGQLQVQIWEAL
jgi:hypothetical protein